MTAIAATEYNELRTRVAGLLEAGMARARSLVDREKARTYWEVGRLLNERLSGRAGYGDQMVHRLAGDLGVNQAILYRAMRFQRRLPKVATWQELSWSHCRALITVGEDEVLESLRERTVAQGWTVRQLEAHIREETTRRSAAGPAAEAPAARAVRAALTPRRGLLGAYRVVATASPDGVEELALDLGFRVRRPLSELGLGDKQARKVARAGLAEQDTVTVGEAKSGVKLRPAAVGRERLFTYPAALRRVVDGDTLEVEVELGLGARIVQRLRLRGIDTAELGTAAGERARAFVEERLRGGATLVVKTFRPDKYDRYLTDVFYGAGEDDAAGVAAEGAFLNGELLEEELAALYA